jgi:hypothetical protein
MGFTQSLTEMSTRSIKVIQCVHKVHSGFWKTPFTRHNTTGFFPVGLCSEHQLTDLMNWRPVFGMRSRLFQPICSTEHDKARISSGCYPCYQRSPHTEVSKKRPEFRCNLPQAACSICLRATVFQNPEWTLLTRCISGENSAVGAWDWQPYHHLWADCLHIVGSLTSHNPRPPRPVTGIAFCVVSLIFISVIYSSLILIFPNVVFRVLIFFNSCISNQNYLDSIR